MRVFPLLVISTMASVAAPAAPVSFSRQIAPILADQCLECHRAGKAKGSYRLDSFAQMLKPGDSGEAPVAAGKADASLLHQLLVIDDEADRMPKKADPLPAKDIALIRQWIAEGAKFDGPDARAPLTAVAPQERPRPPEKYPRPIPVTALALNGDGKILATSGYHEVLLWETMSGKLQGRIGNLPERILGLSFVAGGPWLAVAGGSPGRSGEVWLVNAAEPAQRKRLAQMRDCALAVVVTPDGTRLVSGDADNHVRCFALPEGTPQWDLEMHADWIVALAVSPDGKHIATGGRDRTARVVETATGVIDGTFTGHGVPVLSVAFAPDGQEIISGGADGEARRWDLTGTGKKDTTIKAALRNEVLALAYLDQETPVAATGAGQVHTLDLKSRRPKTVLATHPDRVNALSLWGSGEARRLITGSHDGQIQLRQPGEPVALLQFVASPGW